MFKRIILICLLFVSSVQAQKVAQCYVSNYDAIESGRFNPALIGSNGLQFQASIVGLYTNVANNYLELKITDLAHFDRYRNLSEIRNGKDKYLNYENEISGPGFMFRVGDANAFSISTKVRSILSINDFQEDFATSMYNHAEDILLWLPDFDDFRATVGLNAYHEISLGYSRKLLQKGKHQIYVGGSAKLLTNIAAGSFHADNVSFRRIVQGLQDTVVNVGYSKFDLFVSDNYDTKTFKYKFGINGIGIDVGAVYEFRKNADDADYFIKSGISLNDVGSMSYNLSSKYSRSFVGTNRSVPIQNLIQGVDSLKIDQALDSLGIKTIPSGTKRINLPTTINAFADVSIVPKFYTSVAVQMNLHDYKKGIGKANLPTSFVLTPRFETKLFAAMLPVHVDKYGGFNAGIALRVGQFGIGSSNIITTLLRSKTTNFNIFFSTNFAKRRNK